MESRPNSTRDLVAALDALPPTTLILDGAVVIFDEHLISRFEWLRHLNDDGQAATPQMLLSD